MLSIAVSTATMLRLSGRFQSSGAGGSPSGRSHTTSGSAAPSGAWPVSGTPMLSMGDEAGRTQHGNNHAYAQDNASTAIRWEGVDVKLQRFVSRLIRSGLGTADLARLICPIGVPGINNKDPDVIAISVAAQVMLLREQHDRRRPASVEASCSSCPREAEGLCV